MEFKHDNTGHDNTFNETNLGEGSQYINKIEHVTVNNRSTRLDAYFRRLSEEIESHTTQGVIDDLLEYKTKLDGTKGLEQKLSDGGFCQCDVDWAMRKKEQFAKKATKYECYPSAQKINLLLFAEIKVKFDRYIFPLIKAGEPLEVLMRRVHEEIVDPIMKKLNENGEHDADLNYTSDHIYGMIYYLTGMCHLNWKDYDNI